MFHLFKQTYLSNLNIGLINLFLKFTLCFVGGGGGHYSVNKLTVTSDKLFAHVVTWLQFIFYCHTKLTPCKNEKKHENIRRQLFILHFVFVFMLIDYLA